MRQCSLAASVLTSLAVPENFPKPGNMIIPTIKPKEVVISAHASWHSPRQFLATVLELAWTMDHAQ